VREEIVFRSSVVEIARRNRLLEALPVSAQENIQPHLTPVLLSSGQVLQDSDRDIYWIYFPTSAQISLVVVMTNGAGIESSLVGDEGVVGIELPLGMRRPACRAVVHIAGGALRLNAEILLSEFRRNVELQRLTLYYAQRLMAQLFQTAACNRLHSVEQRLCRWLLHRLDRAPGDDLSLTQEFIANMLGDRRETISVAEGHLQRRGLIRHSRGHILILDRRGLETLACECYSTLRCRPQPLLAIIDSSATESVFAEAARA
jgi:CRP-like cAMP-binding protein